MSDSEILFIIFVCLGFGYFLGLTHAFAKAFFSKVYIQDNKQETSLSDNRNQKKQIECSIRKIDAVLAEVIEQIEKSNREIL